MPDFKEDFSGGLNTAADRADLQPGQLTQSTGGYYKPGDRRLHKMRGRQTYATVSANQKVKAVKLIQFDTSAGNDRLLAYEGTTLYADTDPGIAGTFASLKTGLNASASTLSAAHMNDKWYLANGYDAVLEVLDDGTVQNAGLVGPTQAMTATVTAAAAHSAAVRPTAGSGTFDNESNAYDTDLETFAGASLSAAGTTTTTFTWAANLADTDRKIFVEWGLAGLSILKSPEGGVDSAPFDDSGGAVSEGWNVTVKFQKAEVAGTFTTFKEATLTRPQARQYTQVDFTDAVDISAGGGVRITLTYNTGTTQATLRIYDVRIATGSVATDFSTTAGGTGLTYAFTEYDQTREEESPPSELLSVTLSTQNTVVLTLPGTEQNTRTTHLRIYRNTDNGQQLAGLGLIGEILSSETTFIDDFQKFDKDTQPFPLLPLLKLSTARSDDTSGNALYFSQNSPPPELVKIRAFKGSLVGLSRINPRALYYSMPGRPGSWPAIYVIESFPLEEHDKLVDLLGVGDALVIAAEDAMMRTFNLPRVVQGTFDASEIVKIQGAPGCVGNKAMTSVPIRGQSHAAWISPEGINITNGEQFDSISDGKLNWCEAFEGETVDGVQITHDVLDDMDKSNWVLHYVKSPKMLYFCFSSVNGGENDLYYTARVPTGTTGDDELLWSGPHPGNINSITSGRIGGKPHVWTAHSVDGKVYTEWTTGDDDSNSYDTSGNWPLIVRSRRVYGDESEWRALSGNLQHTDFGTNQEVTLRYTTGRDSPAEETTLEETVSVVGHRGTETDIARAGEWHEWSVSHVGVALKGAALREFQIEADGSGRRGTVKVA